ncbi:MAG: DUF3048 domain-containing protein [Clostridia bacterium]|nr:DUF3048 domain-containing protein [Clostridia bacterium]
MKFKLFSLFMALVMVFVMSGCGDKEIAVSTSSEANNVTSTDPLLSEDGSLINPLTGVKNLDSAANGQRPVAIMVNNISLAQSVQSGLSKADIVYEAYAEGGITRLMAVFKDANKIPRVGSVRSARYSYVDLAMGHDAIYVHAGINESHCTPHVKETGIDNINLNSGAPAKYGMRISNGLASEHTLYTNGENLVKCFNNLNWRTKLNSSEKMWQSFVDENSPITLTGGASKEINIKMSAASTTKFVYDSTAGKFVRYKGSSAMKDFTSGEQFAFTNVLVLETELIALTTDGIVKTNLEGGTGYYFTKGTYQKIKWSKGAVTNGFKITLEDGSECKFNAGNTWVSLMDKTQGVNIVSE